MAKVVVLDVDENSLDNSADNELLGMVDEGSLGSADCERSQLVSQSFLDNNEENSTSYNFKDLSGTVAYKLIPMTGNQTPNNMATESITSGVLPSGEFYVIGNPVQVFGTEAGQKKVVRRKSALQNKVITAKKRDDKRRATHNEVERRRRDKINSWITKLAALVPNSGLQDTASKGGILAKACDHITELTERQKKLEKLEVDNDKLVLEVLRLNQELADLRKENASMRSQLADNCIVTMQNRRARGQKS
ncbi:upstream stimulatory factor 2 [Danaus plexippus]|uniref:upstream stimulatory factor 2 n=1 Tax=Danaus plexippus TaxID=13037 RepID=UPI002AB16A2D|nr:upstream stimulatory factor 2 [Danaus plexippus]